MGRIIQDILSALWKPALRDHWEFILPYIVERIPDPVLGPLAAYALHLGMKVEELNSDKEARKFHPAWAHLEFFVLWLLGLWAETMHPALGFLAPYILHLTIKAVTLTFRTMKK